MPTIADSEIPPPKSWDVFEEICADLFECVWEYPNAERYGRQGQRQNGVDVYGRPFGKGHAGVQCKGKAQWPPSKLTKKEIDREVANALKFEPALTELVFATTALNDVAIQDHVHSITEAHEKQGLFSVHVYWWPEITRRITQHDDLIQKHFGYTQIGQIERKIDALSEQTSKIVVSQSAAELVDREMRIEQERLRKARFFEGFDKLEAADSLADRVLKSDFQSGSDTERASALCLSARLLAYDQTARAEELLSLARKLGAPAATLAIVGSFIIAAKGGRELALNELVDFDLPEAKSAAFFIVSNGQDAVDALAWLAKVNYSLEDLDSDGKFQFLAKCLEINEWQTALKTIESIVSDDYHAAPVLYFVAAMAHLVQAVPEELRPSITQQPPFEVDSFLLDTTTEMLTHCRSARKKFEQFAAAAECLGFSSAADVATDYALWLGLRDPVSHKVYLGELRKSMSDRRHSLRRLNFAIRFGLPVDVDEATKEIDRQTALTGGNSIDAALARFALAFKISSEARIVEYLNRHRSQLVKHINATSIARLEIEMLSRSGQVSIAESRLQDLERNGLDERICSALALMIKEAKGADPVTSRIAEYESDKSLINLFNLMNVLERQKSWEQLASYARILLDEVPSVDSAEKLAGALSELGQMSEIHVLLSHHIEFLEQSDFLKSLWCASLYQKGDLQSASHVLAELRAKDDNSDHRQMAVHLAIASGNWGTLTSHVEAEWLNKEQRSAEELIRAAQLAQIIHSPRTRELTRQTVLIAEDDPQILASAYLIATQGGWEEDSEVAGWLKAAIENSDESGPIQRISLDDMLDRNPAWRKREEDTWQTLKRGEVPIFGAAASINRTLIDQFLVLALSNAQEPDPRRRSHIFAYSGALIRTPHQPRKIALDATSLLTLSILDLTELVIDSFDEISIPHTTLGWLFAEKQRIQFHQPSRVRAAMELRALLQSGQLQQFVSTATIDPDLSADVGRELASLLAEADVDASESGGQRLVVSSYPVHKVGSLMKETADLSDYCDHLCSCRSIVAKLWQKGQLTASQREKAQMYLSLNEERWPNEPTIMDGAILYLDGLAVNYLHRVGALPKLKNAGIQAFVSLNESQDLGALLNYDSIAKKAEEIIEKLRSNLALGISSKKIKLGPLPAEEDSNVKDFRSHPTVSILDAARLSDAAVVDDRFINQHKDIVVDGAHVPIITSSEVLDLLLEQGHIQPSALFEYRTIIRKSGLMFFAVQSEELQEYLQQAQIVDGELQETANLKAVRESILQNRMATALVLPKEAVWLAELRENIAEALRIQWVNDADIGDAVARSNWLLELLDMSGWSQSAGFEGGRPLARSGYFALAFSLLRSPPDGGAEIVSAYWVWLERTVLEPLKENDPEVFEDIMSSAESTIFHVVEMIGKDTPNVER